MPVRSRIILLIWMYCFLVQGLVGHKSSALTDAGQVFFLFDHTLTTDAALKGIITVFHYILQFQARHVGGRLLADGALPAIIMPWHTNRYVLSHGITSSFFYLITFSSSDL